MTALISRQLLTVIICFLATVAPSVAGPDGGGTGEEGRTGPLTLNNAIVRALALDPSVRKKYADVTEAHGYSREMRSGLGPQVRLEGSAGWANRDRSIDGISSGGDDLFSRQIGVVFEQLLYDGGFNWYRWKDAEQRLKAEQLLEIARREATSMELVSAYLNVIRARDHIVLAKSNIGLHSRIMDLSEGRAVAVGNQADVDLSTARYHLAETLLKERELSLKQAEVVLFRYTALRPTELVRAKQPRFDSRSQVDVTQNFHYQAALHQREAATIAKNAVSSRYHPRFLLRGTGGVGEDVLGIRGQDNEASALVVVQWDIFDSGRRAGLMEQAIADIDRQTGIIDETLLAITQDVDSRWEDYITLAERIGILEAYAGELNKTVSLYEEQFDLGTRPLLSMLDIKNEEISAKIRLVDERFEYNLGTYRLLFLSGNLISNTVGSEFLESPRESTTGGRHQVHPTIASEPLTAPTYEATGLEEEKQSRKNRILGWFKRD